VDSTEERGTVTPKLKKHLNEELEEDTVSDALDVPELGIWKIPYLGYPVLACSLCLG